ASAAQARLQLLLPGLAQEEVADIRGVVANRYRRNGAKEKVLGAVYTPPRVAAALTRWAVRHRDDVVVDPSCGEGVFLAAARTRLSDLGARKPVCLGVDIDGPTAVQSGAVCADFFAWAPSAPKADAVIGNPPFIRSHLFPESSRELAFPAMRRLGLNPSRLMSTWAPFLALSCGLLKPAGRLAMVIPEELLAVGYAEELRRFLLRQFHRVIVCLPGADIFPEVQQAVVLLLCDNDMGKPAGLFTLDYASLEEGNPDAVECAPPWDWNPKWTHLFLRPAERLHLAKMRSELGWEPFSAYGRVEVGIVTGENSYFVLPASRIAGLPPRHLQPIVSSARDLRGIRFGAEDFNRMAADDRPAYLLNLGEPDAGLNEAERVYLALGEKEGVPHRYKCRIRDPWYAVPSVWEPDAVLLRQSGEMPRLIHLAKKCTATDTIHRVTWRKRSQGKQHTASFMNSWTLLAAELTGRSYGGGVLELMPGEANRLPLPPANPLLDDLFDPIDECIRARDHFGAVDLVDRAVFARSMSPRDQHATRGILAKLIKRRQTRAN
ncbi:MAG: N-6 DNA methylase, partial [Phycisphaerae bacterium]|nr:N-6 DNA methylase [Phycisphaerae bacterium]